jgi:hypothetical protein
MNLESGEGTDEQQEEPHQLMHVTLAQGAVLPDNRAYLDGCSTLMAFKCKKYLKGVKRCDMGIKINCNVGRVTTSLMGKYSSINPWYIPKEIANIFLMHELEEKHWVTYDSWEGYYVLHMASGPVKFDKDEQGLPYIDLDRLGGKAAVMLPETAMEINGNEANHRYVNVQTVHYLSSMVGR